MELAQLDEWGLADDGIAGVFKLLWVCLGNENQMILANKLRAKARWVDQKLGLVTDPEETEAPVRRRLMLRRENFFKLGFTKIAPLVVPSSMATSVELILNLAEAEWKRSCKLLMKVEEDWKEKD